MKDGLEGNYYGNTPYSSMVGCFFAYIVATSTIVYLAVGGYFKPCILLNSFCIAIPARFKRLHVQSISGRGC